MIRSLAPDEIERVLTAEAVGRIGCATDWQPYVVPVSYAYVDGAIYAHSGDGLKIRMMRQNPRVCFEVDHVEDLVNWHSVICVGRYEELDNEEARRGLEVLRAALRERMPRSLAHGQLAAEEPTGHPPVVIFRLTVEEMTGREERLYWELLPPVANLPTADGGNRHADAWLSQARARELCDLARVLEIDAIWEAADSLAQHRSYEEVARSLMYRGVDADMARRIVGFMTEQRDQPVPIPG